MKRITKKIYLVIAVIVGAITTVGAWTLWKVIDPARAPRLYGPPHEEEEIRCIYGPPSMFEQNSEENDSGAQKVDSIREKQENQQRKKE